MREVAIIGVGMTKFGKFIDRSLKDLGREACWSAIKDARSLVPRTSRRDIWRTPSAAVITGQTMVLGEVAFREVGVIGVPIINIENACASGSSALMDAWMAVSAGFYDLVIVAGVEKLYANDTQKTVEALAGAGDVELEMSVGRKLPCPLGAARHQADGDFRHHARALRQGLGQEPPQRLPESALAIPEGMHDRAGDERQNHRLAA